jgi:hypothetical protein
MHCRRNVLGIFNLDQILITYAISMRRFDTLPILRFDHMCSWLLLGAKKLDLGTHIQAWTLLPAVLHHTFITWVHVLVEGEVEASSFGILTVLNSRFLVFCHFEILIKCSFKFSLISLVDTGCIVDILNIRAVLTQFFDVSVVFLAILG